MNLDEGYLQQQKDFYKNQLLNDTIPFWFPKSIDEEFGGFLNSNL
jgi:N-acylglucosamine 2-epimerase